MGHLQREQVCFKFFTVLAMLNVFAVTETFADVTDPQSSSSYYLFQSSEYPKDCQDILSTCSVTHNASGVYRIKPAGFPEPFEVYCDNDLHSGGWTILQRRSNGFINFNRNWIDYKEGFGFLGSEFWLGNEKIAYLTNQRNYQIRLEFENAAGQTYHVTYDHFSIGDEWGNYALSLGAVGGTVESYIEWCPSNREYANTSICERSCTEPDTCITSTSTGPESCICPNSYMIDGEDCKSQNQCGCFVQEKGSVLHDGGSFVNSGCTARINCTNNQLNTEDGYRCSDDATCGERDGVRRCYCNDMFDGDGITCIRNVPAKDCYDLYINDDIRSNGVYTIYPTGWEASGFQVYCEMSTDGGGWTVLQRRSSGSVNFYRGWNEYKNGFESQSGDHWLGNDKIHGLTNTKTYQLRVDLANSGGSRYYALYSTFSISDEDNKYTLSLGSYSGNSGYNSMNWNSGDPFSTHDRDNDGTSGFNCAEKHRGAWWYPSRIYDSNYCFNFDTGYYCTVSNLNGDYQYTDYRGIFWYNLPGSFCGITGTTMRIRPVQ